MNIKLIIEAIIYFNANINRNRIPSDPEQPLP
uniref:Uncharacterized protein n=1 Tax=Anguilla anguilla TaxID=7936 RepID=A0A0E9PQ28_ANGAN